MAFDDTQGLVSVAVMHVRVDGAGVWQGEGFAAGGLGESLVNFPPVP